MTRKVTIVQRILPHYRVPFFRLLEKKLCEHDVEFELLFGRELTGTVPKTMVIEDKWAIEVENRYFSIFGREFIWQPIFAKTSKSDIVVVEQANRLLINYLLLLKRVFSTSKLAFWGHGKNFQAKGGKKFSEMFKRLMCTNVDWWFGYTDMTRKIVSDLGFNPKQITVVRNSIDTRELAATYESITESESDELANEMGISGGNVAIYCGGLYEEKRIPFLLESCAKIKQQVDDFAMIIIGDGPHANYVQSFAAKNKWLVYLGPISGSERVKYFALSKVMLMPGLVGLAVLDSFALSTPMITTDIPIHSPEFEYLESGVNGVVTKDSIIDYASQVTVLLDDTVKLQVLVDGCIQSKHEYTVEAMAERYSEGLIKLLESKSA
jgi:glycosyltransferase involved in cell wall biosynthesis